MFSFSKPQLVLLSSLLLVGPSFAFTTPPALLSRSIVSRRLENHAAPAVSHRSSTSLYSNKKNQDANNAQDNGEDTAEDFMDVDGRDWRAFRAKLVREEPEIPMLRQSQSSLSMEMQGQVDDEEEDFDDCVPSSGECDLDGIGKFFEKMPPQQQHKTGALSNMTPLDPSQWAYESGTIIEQGAVVLGGVEQDFGYGLRQQYFHKAAILILDHEESIFTKGIILNRPTDLVLRDDVNPGIKWKVWFGGDVQGIESEHPDIVCLHSVQNRQAHAASVPVMKDIQWTTFENAKKLVHAGAALPEDFQVFCGYAGWGPGQLHKELDQKSWYMVATDSQTLLKEMATTANADPRDAGLETWNMLMHMIGRGQTANENEGGFDDLMLREWSLHHLVSKEAGGGAGDRTEENDDIDDVVIDVEGVFRKEGVDQMMDRASAAAQGQDLLVGDLVRSALFARSPFLFDNQELHKALILVLSDDDKYTVGAIINRPAAKGLDLHVTRKNTGKSQTLTLPLRFGGQFSVNGAEPLLWVHRSESLRSMGVGAPIGPAETGIWKCTNEEVTKAISHGVASADEFFVITGVSVWTKENANVPKGLQGEIERGQFEIVPHHKAKDVWDALSSQRVLTSQTLKDNLAVADEAWSKGAPDTNHHGHDLPSINPREVGHENQDDNTLVFKSNIPVSQLADVALKNWVTTFLLGLPVESYDTEAY
ncbi:hypothetical protein MPSEU_000925400 [Mayamaea pseudoterrestris]|nr:hypothetical protein MPSEU_000925400 [Mayamaea pseudoterrestris]